jgi:DNA-binding transcriptional MerR regulator
MEKSADAFRTISEVADELDLPQHVLRFWETRFPQIKPLKRAGGRRFYRPNDVDILRAIRRLLYSEGYTIKGVQRILKEQGARAVIATELAESDAGANAPAMTQTASIEQADARWGADLFEQTPDVSSQDVSSFSASNGAPEARSQNEQHIGESALGAHASRAEMVDRLKALLRELDECERMLDAARRP